MTTEIIKASVKSISPEVSAERYKAILVESLGLSNQFKEAALCFYWHIGDKVIEITGLDRSDSYGKNLLDKFSEDLLTYLNLSISPSLLYKGGRIRKALSAEQFELAKAGRISFNQALRLSSGNVPTEVRQDILEESKKAADNGQKYDIEQALSSRLGISSGEPSSSDGGSGAGDEASAGSGGSDADSSKAPTPLKGIRGIPDLFDKTAKQLKFYKNYVEEICEGDDPDKMQKAQKLFKEACGDYNTLANVWVANRVACESAFEKVKDILE